MHYIQKHILDELRTVGSMRYARLNTDGIESGHFRYHLEQLMGNGYVDLLDRGVYALSARGQQYVDKLSSATINPSPMPKVITYALLRDGGTVLLQKKTKQPYLGLLNMIGGKLHRGELARDAAVREVREKTGQTIESPRLAGIFEIIITQAGEIHTHAVAYVFVADIRANDFAADTLIALEADGLEHVPDLAPDFLPIYNKITGAVAITVDTIEADLS